MTEKRLESLIKRFLHKYIKKLSLDRYEIDYDLTLENGNWAEAYVSKQLSRATIRFNKAKLLNAPNEIEVTVAHELLHVFFHDETSYVTEFMKTLIHDPSLKDFIINNLNQYEESKISKLEGLLGVQKLKNKKRMANKPSGKSSKKQKEEK